MKNWICGRCGQEVFSKERPDPIRWTDGHVCRFIERHGERYNEVEPYKGEPAKETSRNGGK